MPFAINPAYLPETSVPKLQYRCKVAGYWRDFQLTERLSSGQGEPQRCCFKLSPVSQGYARLRLRTRPQTGSGDDKRHSANLPGVFWYLADLLRCLRVDNVKDGTHLGRDSYFHLWDVHCVTPESMATRIHHISDECGDADPHRRKTRRRRERPSSSFSSVPCVPGKACRRNLRQPTPRCSPGNETELIRGRGL